MKRIAIVVLALVATSACEVDRQVHKQKPVITSSTHSDDSGVTVPSQYYLQEQDKAFMDQQRTFRESMGYGSPGYGSPGY
jgi:hypothetical protein